MLAENRADILSPRKGVYPFVLLSKEVPTHWELLEPMIVRSVQHSHGSVTLEGIKTLLAEGTAVCMGLAKETEPVMVLVVQISCYHGYRAATVIAAAGSRLKEAQPFMYILEEWAISLGATQIDAACRPAMVRLLQRFGFKPKFTIVSKKVEPRRLQ